MKYFLCFMISASAFAQSDVEVQKVRSFEVEDGIASITFADEQHVYRLPEESGVVPCLKNGWEATQKVIIKVDQKKNVITDCRLYSAGVLGFQDEEPAPKAQAQEAKKETEKPVKKP